MTVIAGACIGAAVVAAGSPAHGAVIVHYSLPTSGGTTTSSPVTQVHADATASSYTAHGGTQIGTTGSHFLRVDAGSEPTNAEKVASIENAIFYEVYAEFSVSAAPDMGLNLSSLAFGMRNDRGIVGQSFTVHVRSSLDDYATDIATVSQVRVDDETIQGPDAKSVDLTAATFQQLTGTVTFRLYMVTDIANNTGSSENIRIMPDIILDGAVVAVPEPAALTLAGLGSVVMLGRRRRVR